MKRFEGIPEGTSPHYTATITDQDGNLLGASDLATLKLTLKDARTGAIINGRDRQNILNTNGVTVDESGNLSWILAPADTPIFCYGPGESETHVALFEWTYGPGAARRGSHRIEFLVESDFRGFELIRGDAYSEEEGRAITLQNRIGVWPDLAEATVTLSVGDELEVEGEVVEGTPGSEQIVRFEPSATDTEALPAGSGYGKPLPFDIEAKWSSGRRMTLALGTVLVKQDVTA